MDASSERAARAQTIFRAGNEALARAAGSRDGAVPFMCECADERCLAELTLPHVEYEAVRAHARRFVVVNGHEATGADDARIVERRDGYSVIEKQAEAGDLAAQTDPRGGDGHGAL
jgi:hypothetical protein